MAKASRRKGVDGERESADVFRRYGFEVVTLQNNVEDAGDYLALWQPMTVQDEASFGPDVSLLVESKRRERLNQLAACKQVEAVARDGQIPLVVWRPNREPWRFSGRLEDFARLLGTTT